MNILHKAALKGLIKNRTRTLVTVIGVAMSAAMITAVAAFGVSLLHYLAEGAAVKYGGWHIACLDADASYAREWAGDEDAADTAFFENIGYAAPGGGKNPKRPYLFIAGFNRKTFDTLPITLISGRLPENSGEILLSGKMGTDGGFPCSVGDTLTLEVGKRMSGNDELGQKDPYRPGDELLAPQGEKTYRVVGICGTPVFEDPSYPGYTAITRTDARDTSGAAVPDTADSLTLFVTLKHPRQVRSYARQMADGHDCILNHDLLRIMGLSDSPSDRLFNAFLFAFAGVVIAIIMIGSVFLIHNSFSISLNERTQQIGIFASVGATSKQLRNSVLFEGLCIGAAGIPLGILAGLGSMGLVLSIIARNLKEIFYDNVPLTLQISFPAIAGAAAVSLVTILISAYLPARKAASTPVMECIRQTNEIKVESKAVRVSKWEQRLYGLEGTLALKNFRRNKRRYRSIVLSLVLSIVLFISSSTLVEDLRRISDQAKIVTDYDIGFGTKEMDDDEMLRLYEKMGTAEGVTDSSYQTVMRVWGKVRSDDLSDAYWEREERTGEETELPLEIQFLDDETYLKLVERLALPVEEYTGPGAKLPVVGQIQDIELEKGDSVNNMFRCTSMDLAVVPEAGEPGAAIDWETGTKLTAGFVEAVPPDIPPTMENTAGQDYFCRLMAPYSLKEKIAPPGTPADITVKGLTFQSEDSARSMAGMEKVIQEEGITDAYLLLDTTKLLRENRSYRFVANLFAYTFIILISLIAAANVFNTISTNIRLRRRELAMLRSMGMPERDFNKMMCFECLFYGQRALVFGLPLSVAASWLVHQGTITEEIAFQLPWGSMGISVLSVLLVIFVTMMYAVRKIKKENIIDALRDDMA